MTTNDDSREAFEAWAAAQVLPTRRVSVSDWYRSDVTRSAYKAWLAALAWRGSKPEKIAEVVSHATGYNLIVCGVDVAGAEGPTFLRAVADAVNKAHGREGATDGN